jgi:hypothetical protein
MQEAEMTIRELLKPLLEEFFLFAKSGDKEFLTW